MKLLINTASFLNMDDKNPKATDKLQKKLAGASSIDKTLQPFSLQQSVIDKAVAAMARPLAIDKALKSIVLQQSTIDKAVAAMARPLAIDKALQSIVLQQSAIDKAVAVMARPLVIDKALQSIVLQQSTIDKAITNMIGPSVVNQAIRSILVSQTALERAVKSFAQVGSVILAEPNYLSEIAHTVSNIDFNTIDTPSVENSLEEIEAKLLSVENRADFFSVFSNFPPFIQAIFFYFLIHIFIPQVNSISANLLTPIVESFLENNDSPNRYKIKEIKSLSLPLQDVNTSDLRFITGDNVRLRAYHSTNSKILDELTLGQVVNVLSKRRNWIEVMYEYGDDESLSGWVFTRYTAKFTK